MSSAGSVPVTVSDAIAVANARQCARRPELGRAMRKPARRNHALKLAAVISGAAIVPLAAPLVLPGPVVQAAETLTVVNAADQGAGSLRAALDRANSNGNGFDVIRFAIPGSGRRNIQLRSTLFVNEPVLIDGTSQPGYGGSPLVQVLGDGATSSLFLMGTVGGSTIRGLGMSFYRNNAVTILAGSPGNVLESNWIGFALGPRGEVYRNSLYYPFTAGVGIQSNDNLLRGNVI
ncbi:MAG: hypothetical protein ACRDZ2_11515, partial [Ilumatobacteraceae bacterium]